MPSAPGESGSSTVHPGLDHFNHAEAATAESALHTCCASRQWARRVVAHRPYPDLDALLAAADEASYDLAIADLDEALAGESPGGPHPDVTPRAAQLALGAAHAKYEST
ncbi:2-oxo-4-hydroxy-4-carboxy-5-ureidoimidazoline decarboxylase, partial [Streptomyces sp. T-3]|nr:2-oxo-4-hydroxy-4-carboxy-5-ureidoimidazoline decarboxylase [Streptomyces sp. T-3]